ncbi:signal recognition particle-docking protein FtsY [Candidatus Endowatersipora endosymbiont of Watersipora subatra]|uniref:signal recognition particle-docking protein FtsY n=1 Tax=Candidatus Endowatersipora endosymbiont of Watersipora subatra TaxID=3077946 RepID=UPI00312C99EA
MSKEKKRVLKRFFRFRKEKENDGGFSDPHNKKQQVESEGLESESIDQGHESIPLSLQKKDQKANQYDRRHFLRENCKQGEGKYLESETHTKRLSKENRKKEVFIGKKSWISRLRNGLALSSNELSKSIKSILINRKLDEKTVQNLEDILIQADLGVQTAVKITDLLASQRMGKDISDEEVRIFMAHAIEKVLEPVAAELELDLEHKPHVILVVGVNGSGKTTTVGKLSKKLCDVGYSVLLVAGDTFRAAAIEQLKIWGNLTNSSIISSPPGSDPAGLVFKGFAQARDEGSDVMLIDTAGRLQNKKELMDELEKIIRVLKKQSPKAPHTVLLTLDATTGQNALSQVNIFKDVAKVNGLVMTKLDGTARGGVMVAIASKHKLPFYFIGVGEKVEDLEPFDASEFARSIAGLEI